MGILQKDSIFILETKNLQYAISADETGVYHLHWGDKCRIEDFEIPHYHEENSNHPALDFAKTEYIPLGSTMYRECALKCVFSDGCRDTVLKYQDYKINGNTLEINLCDKHYPLAVTLVYKIFENSDIIERYTIIKNLGENCITLEKAASAEINLPETKPYTIINSNGSWGAEFRMTKQSLKGGEIRFESRKGTTGHHHMPALIAGTDPQEEYGRIYFAVLAFSGNFCVEAERDFTGRTRAILGINSFDFSHTLHSGEEFVTPSVYCGISDGLGDMSNMLNEFAVSNVLPKNFADKELPVLYNSWEATGFDVNEKHQLELAKKAAEIGCELFVMDDGWFSSRNNDQSGLGDWDINTQKFPEGLTPLIDGVNALGMDFGLWFEPEMVSPKSRLYEEHPEWAYHYDARTPNLLRNQTVLNMTKSEVQEYVFSFMDSMLSENNIKYIKWDMNRPFSEIGAENLENQKELWVRHSEGVFEVLDRLREKHPSVQFEACASGGGRTDLGALSHYDMVWPSDNTDPVDRLDIQRGYSLIYPIKCMRAWVTQTNENTRPTSLQFRLAVSMQGSLSIGSNLGGYSEKELEICKKYISLYKEIRNTVQFGNLYRIMNYEDDGIYLNGYVNKDKSQAVYFACTGANSFFADKFVTLRFRGLDENAVYRAKSEYREYEKSGVYFMSKGLDIKYEKPLEAEIFVLKKIK